MDESIGRVSVVIPTVGRLPLLRRAVESVLACRPGAAEVIVVDQSHGDEVARLVDGFARRELRRVEDPGRGIGCALNIGLRSARHPLLLVTHDDCTVREDWVRVASRLLAQRPALLVTGRVEPSPPGADVPSCKTSTVAEEHRTGFRYDLLYCNNWAAARAEIVGIGGFDERAGLRLAAEDCDLCFRWTVLGRPIRYEPEMVVWHHDWRGEAHLRRTYRAYARGLGVFYAKHLLAGHRALLTYLRSDLVRGLENARRRRLRREPGGPTADGGLLPWLPLGFAAGVAEELWLRRPARRRP
jgi:GT2 family glycosyltransferase